MYFFIHYFFHGGDVMDYEINSETCAILPVDIATSKIVENSSDYVVNDSSLAVLEHSCEYFGSSYDGRKVGSKDVLNSSYKLPIVVEDTRNLVFFPTTSPLDEDCSWISLKNIKEYRRIDDLNTEVEFKNGKIITVGISYNSFNNQVLRASRLESILRNRREKAEKTN